MKNIHLRTNSNLPFVDHLWGQHEKPSFLIVQGAEDVPCLSRRALTWRSCQAVLSRRGWLEAPALQSDWLVASAPAVRGWSSASPNHAFCAASACRSGCRKAQ